jgi:hypothetical protein
LRLRFALWLVLLVATVGCGAGRDSPEHVVRAWSDAVNAGDNERAADLFSPGAEVVQGNAVLRLHTHREAVAWNAGLPCSGTIVSLEHDGDEVTVTFVLGDRKSSRCDGPGGKTTALIVVRHGKIVLWHQTGSQPGATA